MGKIYQKLRGAQTAIEYLLLFALGAVVVFVGFRTLLPSTTEISNVYYNKVAKGILGDAAPFFPRAGEMLIRDTPRCTWTPSCDENSSCHVESNCVSYTTNWSPPLRPLMCGRWHAGDENDVTEYWCCRNWRSGGPPYGISGNHTIVVPRESEYHPSNAGVEFELGPGDAVCPCHHPFLYARIHAGGKNAPTYYYCTNVIDDDGKHFCMNGPYNSCEWSEAKSESDGARFICPNDRPFMRGRHHWGDENGPTRYLCCNAMTYPEYPTCDFGEEVIEEPIVIEPRCDRLTQDNCCDSDFCSRHWTFDFDRNSWVYDSCQDRGFETQCDIYEPPELPDPEGGGDSIPLP